MTDNMPPPLPPSPVVQWFPFLQGIFSANAAMLAANSLLGGLRWITVTAATIILVLTGLGAIWVIWTMPGDARRMREIHAWIKATSKKGD